MAVQVPVRTTAALDWPASVTGAVPFNAVIVVAAGVVSGVVTGMLPETLIWAGRTLAHNSASARVCPNRARMFGLEFITSVDSVARGKKTAHVCSVWARGRLPTGLQDFILPHKAETAC